MSALGITVHEPDVVFTDLGLAILGAWFAWRLATPGRRGSLGLAPAVLMAGLASAAFWGAVFHGFFPRETETWPGFIAWIPVSLSIVVAAAALLELGPRVLARLGERTRRRLVATYAAAFAAVVLLVDESFGSIVRFYAPALLSEGHALDFATTGVRLDVGELQRVRTELITCSQQQEPPETYAWVLGESVRRVAGDGRGGVGKSLLPSTFLEWPRRPARLVWSCPWGPAGPSPGSMPALSTCQRIRTRRCSTRPITHVREC